MKKVNAILVNDLHLDKENGELVKDIFRQLVSICKECKTNNIICGGDVFTNRSGQPLSCLTDWKEILSMLKKEGITIHVIPGNHDKTSGDDERSYLDVYSEPNVRLYRKGTCLLLGGVAYLFIPYFKNERWLEEYKRGVDYMNTCNDVINDSPRILISHIGCDGVRNNDGTLVESPIKPSMLKSWNKVLLGHYHNASKIGDNIFYTGSAYQNNYGENITDKGFTLIYNDASIKFVSSKFPKYICKKIQATDKETLRNLIDQYDGETYDHIRFLFVGKKEDFESIDANEIRSHGIDVKFQSDEEIEAIQISEDDSVLCYDKKMIQRDFFRFCSDNEIRGEKMRYGLELLKSTIL